MAWTYETVRTEKAACDTCGKAISKGDTAYRSFPGERPIRYRHSSRECWPQKAMR